MFLIHLHLTLEKVVLQQQLPVQKNLSFSKSFNKSREMVEREMGRSHWKGPGEVGV
jgi:hypothetical protein